MNVAEYGQGLRTIGLENLEALADIERQKQKAKWEQDRVQSQAKAEGLGQLVGAVAGAAKGYSNSRETAYNQKQNENMYNWAAEDEARRLNASVSGTPYVKAPIPQYKPYNLMDDLLGNLQESDFATGGRK